MTVIFELPSRERNQCTERSPPLFHSIEANFSDQTPTQRFQEDSSSSSSFHLCTPLFFLVFVLQRLYGTMVDGITGLPGEKDFPGPRGSHYCHFAKSGPRHEFRRRSLASRLLCQVTIARAHRGLLGPLRDSVVFVQLSPRSQRSSREARISALPRLLRCLPRFFLSRRCVFPRTDGRVAMESREKHSLFELTRG